MKFILNSVVLITCFNSFWCNSRIGPDPWDYVKEEIQFESDTELKIPPDLKIPLKKKTETSNVGIGEWFFRRAFSIVLKGGQSKINEDGSVDVSLQMKFKADKWEILDNYMKSNIALSEEMFRRSLGYLEESILKPSVTEKIAVAWTEYIHLYLIEYKMHITWSLGLCGVFGLILWLWKHMSHKHIITALFIGLYTYEVIISYKEAEQKELDRFLTAVNKCDWYFWKKECEYPTPDPLIFMKHMNPLKILIRIFSTVISEPIISLSAVVNEMSHGITDGLWFPFNKIVHGCLILCINVLLIFILIMTIFNYLLNIPFNLSLLGLVRIGVKQRHRTFNFDTSNISQPQDNTNSISGVTLDRLLEVCSRALDNSQTKINKNVNANVSRMPALKKSASTGRLTNLLSTDQEIVRRKPFRRFMIGGGDGKNKICPNKQSRLNEKC